MKKIYLIFLTFILLIQIPVLANDELVYIDKDGIDTKYHRVTCSHIFPNGYKTISVEDAFKTGYRSCPDCSPPMSDIEKNERQKTLNELKSSMNITQSTSSDEDSRTVYITKDGSKFHSAGCDEMKLTPHALTVTNAQNKGYAPCKVCNPYGLAGNTNLENSNQNSNTVFYIVIAVLIILIIYLIYNDKKHYTGKE